MYKENLFKVPTSILKKVIQTPKKTHICDIPKLVLLSRAYIYTFFWERITINRFSGRRR